MRECPTECSALGDSHTVGLTENLRLICVNMHEWALRILPERVRVMHAMFRHRNQRRRWAASVAFVWLVALGIGLANACLSSGAGTPVGISLEGSAAESAQHQKAAAQKEWQGHAGASDHRFDDTGGHDSSPEKVNCNDFCDRASISVLRFEPSPDDCQGCAVFPAAVVLLMPATPAQRVATWAPEHMGVAAPPIFIAYLRLAL